jgi:hypothetical protein
MVAIKDIVYFVHVAGSYKEELKAENTYITRMREQCGMKASNAADSQARIQVKKEYRDKKKNL